VTVQLEESPCPPPLDLAEIQTRTLREVLGIKTRPDQVPFNPKPALPVGGHFVLTTKTLCEMIRRGELRVERPSLPAAATRKMTTLAELEKKLHSQSQLRKHRYSCQRRQRPSRRMGNVPVPPEPVIVQQPSPHAPQRFVRSMETPPWQYYQAKPYHWTIRHPAGVLVARRPPFWPFYYDDLPEALPRWLIRRKWAPFRGLCHLRKAGPRSWLTRN